MQRVIQRTATEEVELQFRKAAAEGGVLTCKSLNRNRVLNINAQGQPSGKTALHQAVIHNHLPVIEYLLSLPDLQHIEDNQHKTPLDYAKENDAHHVVRLLGKKFPDIIPPVPSSDLCFKYGQIYIEYMQKNAKTMTIEQASLLSQKIPPSSLYMGASLLFHIVLRSHNWEVIRHLIKLGEDPNRQAHPFQIICYRDTPLHLFLANEDPTAIQFVDLVTEEGGKIDFTIRDEQGKTPLLLAAKTRKPKCVQALLERGADVSISIPDNSGNTILHVACILGDVDTFNIIKEYREFNTLLEQANSQGKLPDEMLNLSENETRAFIKSIFINSDRDLNAPANQSKLNEFTPANTTFLKACLDGRKEIEYALRRKNTFNKYNK